jgi:hypothetical protein
VRYVVPNALAPDRQNVLFMRPMVVKNDAVLSVRMDGLEVKVRKLSHVQPSEMIRLPLDANVVPSAAGGSPRTVEVSIR